MSSIKSCVRGLNDRGRKKHGGSFLDYFISRFVYFVSCTVHNLLGALVFTDFLSVQNGGFCFFSMRFVMCEIQLHLLLHFTMQHRFRQEETTEKMQTSFRTGDHVETIKKAHQHWGNKTLRQYHRH